MMKKYRSDYRGNKASLCGSQYCRDECFIPTATYPVIYESSRFWVTKYSLSDVEAGRARPANL